MTVWLDPERFNNPELAEEFRAKIEALLTKFGALEPAYAEKMCVYPIQDELGVSIEWSYPGWELSAEITQATQKLLFRATPIDSGYECLGPADAEYLASCLDQIQLK